MANNAHSTALPLSSIMLKAWREYRFQVSWRTEKRFDRDMFAKCLRDQWAYAKLDAAAALARAEDAERLAASPASERRAAEIADEIKAMEFDNFIDWSHRSALTAELARIAA